MRLHGIDRESWNRYTSSDAAWFYSVVEAGYKYNLTDIAAAIGIEQLKKADSMCEKRKKIARKYIAALEKLDFIELPEYTDEHAWHLFIVRIVPDRITIDRDEFIERLRSSGIGTSVHYIPLHIMPYYKKLYGFKAEDFPIALEHYRTSISLPIYPDLTEEQAYRVIKAIEDIGSLCYKKTLSTPVKTR
jgi:dTDP-4-amino-4,6-dideoxygalactose transaminase